MRKPATFPSMSRNPSLGANISPNDSLQQIPGPFLPYRPSFYPRNTFFFND